MGSKKNPDQLSIKRLINSGFSRIYNKLILRERFDGDEVVKLLSIAVILVNQNDINLKRLGYRIVLYYGNRTDDYMPLYDISLNTGLIPVAKLAKKYIDLNEVNVSNSYFVNEFVDSYVDSFDKEGIVRTEQQLILNEYFDKEIENTLHVVAPTSYGKSELIVNALKNQVKRKACIIVPSKSLLLQTKKRIIDAKIDWIDRIVSHPEMHDPDLVNSVYILTQERLSRLLNVDQNLIFDYLYIDEAHNLLEKDSRSELLASVISAVCHRNIDVAVKFLTPFVTDVSNLNIRTAPYSDLSYFIDEYVKSERFYIADYRNGKVEQLLYDQFTNEFHNMNEGYGDSISYVIGNSADKNIIYFNKPKDIEKFVVDLAATQLDVVSHEMLVAINELVDNVDPDYKLIDCLRKGIAYHHGSMSDSVRNYVEYLFRTSIELKYLVSSSTLLEGVNLPIERLFMMSGQKGKGNLTPSQFKNLVGRVNRFSEIFNSENEDGLDKLEPEIHIIATDEYVASNANFKTYIINRANVTKKIKDKPENVLLVETRINENNIDRYKDAIYRLENLENNLIDDYDYGYVKTTVGKLLVANSVNEINIQKNEEEMQNKLNGIAERNIDNTNNLMDVIGDLFVGYATCESGGERLGRLANPKAKTFYAMMLDWKVSKFPLKLMMRHFINYWDGLYERNPTAQVYVGKWGDEKKDDGHLEHYTKINTKTRKEKVNLAIVRIKEEEDFIEYVIFRFIDILYDMQKIDEEFYMKIKYGTNDENVIRLIRYGFSRGVAELILVEYSDFVIIDIEHESVNLIDGLYEKMESDGVSVFQLFEVEMNTAIKVT